MKNYPIYLLTLTPTAIALMLGGYLAVLILWDKINRRRELKRLKRALKDCIKWNEENPDNRDFSKGPLW